MSSDSSTGAAAAGMDVEADALSSKLKSCFSTICVYSKPSGTSSPSDKKAKFNSKGAVSSDAKMGQKLSLRMKINQLL